MLRSVAVAHPSQYVPQKRDALLFDQILLLGLEENIPKLDPLIAAEIEWLVRAGIAGNLVFNNPKLLSDEPPWVTDCFYSGHAFSLAVAVIQASDLQRAKQVPAGALADFVAGAPAGPYVDPAVVGRLAYSILHNLPDTQSSDVPKLIEGVQQLGYQHAVRFSAAALDRQDDIEAVPILTSFFGGTSIFPGQQVLPVVNLAIDALPVPDDTTPWEAIIEFRADDASRQSLRHLRRWLRAASSQTKSRVELREELEYLLDEYQRYMRLHRIKAGSGRLETVVAVVSDVIINVLDLKFGSALKAILEIKTRNAALLQAELGAPGREVAYIAQARERFSRPG